MIWMQTGQTEKAVERLREDASTRPKDHVIPYTFAVALVRSGIDPGGPAGLEAVEALRASIGANAAFAPARSQLGRLLLRRDDVDGAIDELEKAVELDPGATAALYNSGRCQRKGDRQRASDLLARVRKLNAKSAATIRTGSLNARSCALSGTARRWRSRRDDARDCRTVAWRDRAVRGGRHATGAAQVARRSASKVRDGGRRSGAGHGRITSALRLRCLSSIAGGIASRSSMARTGDRAVDCEILRTRPSLTFAPIGSRTPSTAKATRFCTTSPTAGVRCRRLLRGHSAPARWASPSCSSVAAAP